MLMIVVSIFAFGLMSLSKTKNMPAVSAETETIPTAYYNLNVEDKNDTSLQLKVGAQEESKVNSSTFYKDTLGWVISVEPGTTGSVWYQPRTNEYNGGLPTLRQFEKWRTVDFLVKVYIGSDTAENEIKSITAGYTDKFKVYQKEVPLLFEPTDSEIQKGYFYGYGFNLNNSIIRNGASFDWLKYKESITYAYEQNPSANDEFICKIILKTSNQWPKDYKVSYDLRSANTGEFIETYKFYWYEKTNIINFDYTTLAVCEPSETDYTTDCELKLTATVDGKETTITNTIKSENDGFKFKFDKVIVSIGENKDNTTTIFDSSGENLGEWGTDAYGENALGSLKCNNVFVVAYIYPRYTVKFEPTKSGQPSVSWFKEGTELPSPPTIVVNENTPVVEVAPYEGYPKQWKIKGIDGVTSTYSFVINDADCYVCSGVKYILGVYHNENTILVGSDDLRQDTDKEAYKTSINSIIQLQFVHLIDPGPDPNPNPPDPDKLLPDLHFRIKGIQPETVQPDGRTILGADWKETSTAGTQVWEAFDYYVGLGTKIKNEGNYVSTQSAQFQFGAYKKGNKINYTVTLSLWQGYRLKSITFEAENSKTGINSSVGTGTTFEFARYDSLTITAEIELIEYDFALGYTIKDSVKAGNEGARYSSEISKDNKPYSVNGVDYLDAVKNMLSKINVLYYKYLPNDDSSLKAFFGEDYEPLVKEAVFNGWLLDIDAIQSYGYQRQDETNKWVIWVKDGNGNDTAQSRYWVEFVTDGGTTTTFNGKTYVKVTQVRGFGGESGDTPNNVFDKGNVQGKPTNEPVMFNMIVIPSWSMKYNVEIDNSKTKWTEIDKENDLYGISANGNKVEADNGSIKVKFTLDATTTMAFAYSSKDTAFTKYSDLKSNPNLSLTFIDNANRYTIYNYGFDVVGYTISFKYNNRTYYIYIDGNDWGKEDSIDQHTVNITSLFGADGNRVTIRKSLASMIEAINTWTLGDYTFASTIITIQPVWNPVKIKLTGKFEGEEKVISYMDTYKLEVGKHATIGKSIAYYTAGESIVVCDDGNGAGLPWLYTNITTSNYKYNVENKNIFDFENLCYSLALTEHEVDNIYKVKLINTDNAELSEDGAGTDYVGGTIANSPDVYYYTEWVTCKYSDQDENKIDLYKNKPTENYANIFGAQVSKYKVGTVNYDYTTTGEDVTNAHDYYLRTVYTNADGSMFIYLLNDHVIGDLRLVKPYYNLISWRYNGADGKCNFTTTIYDEKSEGQKNAVSVVDKIFACTADVWTLNCDEETVTFGNLNLSPIFYREQYNLDVNTIVEGLQGFYGYVQLELVDNGNAENNASYIIKFNDAGGFDMYKYIGKDAQNTAGSDVSKLSSSGWVLAHGEKSIVIYPGCEIRVNVYDQSKVTDMGKTNDYYDDMIGYRFAGVLGVQMNNGKGTITKEKADSLSYAFTLHTNDTTISDGLQTILFKAKYEDGTDVELIKLHDNDEISANVTFEPINYSTTVEMRDELVKQVTNSGNIIITNNLTNANGTYKTYNLNLKRGSRFSIYYHAFAGFGLQTPAFSLNEYTGTILKTKTELSSLDMDGTPALVGNDQTYILNMSGAWLRNFYYRENTSYSADKNQGLGNLTINVEYITFSVKYVVYETDDYTTPISNGEVRSNWTLPDVLNWTMPYNALNDSTGAFVTNYMLINENKYAILNAWGYQPRAITEYSLLRQQYNFALTEKPVYSKAIDTDTLYRMVETSAGVIVPEDKRTFTIVVEVSPIYEITMQIEPGKLMGAVPEDQPNDTNCTERSMTISNGVNNNNSRTLTVESVGGVSTIYTHKKLSNSVSAEWNNKYYTSVSFTSNLGEEISSSFTVNGDCTIYANFIPTTLPFGVNYYYQNEGKYITEEQLQEYVTNLQIKIARGELCGITNNADGSHVVANDTITLSYTLNNLYHLEVLVNGAGGRMNSSNQIKVSTADYEASEVLLTLVISDRKKGQINLVVSPDNSNGAVFHNEDLQAMENFASLYISGTDKGKQGSFLEGLKVEIRLGTIPNGYRFVGVKQNYGNINTAWKPVGNTITITNGNCPDGLTNDEFINSISGTYYVLFQKVLINTKMELVTDNLDNYTYSINGNQAVKIDVGNLVLSAGSCSINDTITLVRKSDLANEALIKFYYVNNGVEKEIGTTSPATLKIDTALISSLDGNYNDNNKTITLKVRNIRKYNITFTVSEGAEYLNEISVDDTKLDGNTTFVSQYINANSTANIKISSILKEKFTIAISGGATATSDEIDTTVTMNNNLVIDVKITKNTFALSTSENLYADIMELNNKNPHQLTGNDVVNKNAGKNYSYNTEVKLDFLTNATTEGEKVQLTELHFVDELLTFTFNMNWNGDLTDTVKVADKDGNALLNVDVSKVGNAIQITYTLDGQVYVYKIQQTSSGAQLSFMGQGDAELNLTYTAIKLIENTTI